MMKTYLKECLIGLVWSLMIICAYAVDSYMLGAMKEFRYVGF
jgi:hypothetical protein